MLVFCIFLLHVLCSLLNNTFEFLGYHVNLVQYLFSCQAKVVRYSDQDPKIFGEEIVKDNVKLVFFLFFSHMVSFSP